MTCTQLTSATEFTPAAGRRSLRLTRRIAGAARRAWAGYWDWRARQATAMLLHSLDSRTLHDIGINRSEIESFIYGERGARRRSYDENWRR